MIFSAEKSEGSAVAIRTPEFDLKKQLQGELCDARIVCDAGGTHVLRGGAGDSAKRPSQAGGGGVAGVGVVQQVEVLGAELQRGPLAEWEHARDAGIPIGEGRAPESTLFDVPECAGGVGRKGCRIQEVSAIYLARAFRAAVSAAPAVDGTIATLVRTGIVR